MAALTLIVGDESLLVERAVAGVRAEFGDGLDVHDVNAADLAPGELSGLTAPSLFGGECVVIVRAAQDATAAVAAEIAQLAQAVPEGVALVVTSSGAGRGGGRGTGTGGRPSGKGASLMAALSASGARRIDCPPVRRFGERMDFLRAEFARAGRKADDRALRALLDAVGTDLRDLAMASDQLASDTEGVITADVVARYWRGRAEATGFSVADRALEGNLADALAQLRWALAIGTAPVLITSALARGLRALGQVGAAGRKSSEALAAELGMPPWQVDRARQQLHGWSAAGLARAHSAVALADAQVKGEGVSAGYALERALRVIAESRA